VFEGSERAEAAANYAGNSSDSDRRTPTHREQILAFSLAQGRLNSLWKSEGIHIFFLLLFVLIVAMADYMSVSEDLKLVSPFKGDKKEVLAFISNVDTAFEVIKPDYSDILYKFVLTRISGEPRVAITHRN